MLFALIWEVGFCKPGVSLWPVEIRFGIARLWFYRGSIVEIIGDLRTKLRIAVGEVERLKRLVDELRDADGKGPGA